MSQPEPIEATPADVVRTRAAASTVTPPVAEVTEPEGLEFPGCRPMRLTARAAERFEGRFEYWDGDTETAWVVREPTSDTHEQPGEALAQCCREIALVRGSGIKCLGSMDLWLRDEHGRRRKILQADQAVYLHPRAGRLPEGDGMAVGVHDFPDVVLEVDHTTDVRRGKLKLYEAWGFPEVWVEVPERFSRSRPRGLYPGLTILLLDEDGRYRSLPSSRAFPGWRAQEIHTAMNELDLSERTSNVLYRVGTNLGGIEGTGPDATPWLRRLGREKYAEGLVQGEATGRAEEIAGIKEKLMERILGPDFPRDLPELAGLPDRQIVDLLLQSADESDFRARLSALPRR